MNDFWETLRFVNLIVLFGCFMSLIYRGVLQAVKYKNSFEWDKLMNLVWVTFVLYALIEVVYIETQGGPRVVLQFLVALLQVYVVTFHYDTKKDLKARVPDKETS